MAKTKSLPSEAEKHEQLLAGLRKAMAGGSFVLSGETAASKALFIGKATTPAPELARQALEGKLVEVVPPPKPPPKGKPALTYVRLTEMGRDFIRANEPLDLALTEMLPLVRALAERLPSLLTALERLQEARAQPSAQPLAPAAKPALPLTAPPLRTVLRNAYDQCTRYADCQDGLVDLPRLYHETKKTLAALTVAALHRELEAMWSERILELKILNEVRLAREPDLGIRRDGYLYYYVFWKRP